MTTREKLVEYRRLLTLLPDNVRYEFQGAVTEKQLQEVLKNTVEWANEMQATIDQLQALLSDESK